ncbi:MAG: glycosyltransferase, partial [Deltaproteobacteria bacterium]|nr:glycosyltransferase [Deltaproteobacteria bacterium]
MKHIGKPGPIPLTVLLQDLEFGGTQRYALHLLKHLDRGLFSPELWILRGGTDLLPQVRAADIKTAWLTHLPKAGPLSIGRLFFQLCRSRPAILYTLTALPNIWGRVLGRLARVPIIVSGYRSLLPGQYERWLWPLSDRIICNADVLKSVMMSHFKINPAKIEIVPNAVDSDYFFPGFNEPSPDPTVLSIGRLVEEKDPFTLITAFREVSRIIPSAKLIMVGNGPLKKQVETLIKSQGIESCVSLLPARSDIRPYLAKAWVFTLPSRSEASPNVILEAMAAGLPVVAGRVGGIPELVRSGVTGHLFAPGDSTTLARTLVDLL